VTSIIIASYNYARFLAEAIESALAQTHRDIEVIVVDDGSTDDSVEVASRYPVRVIEKANEGVARTRNRGASEARGEYVVFLDADDVLQPTFIERCLQAIGDAAYAYTQVEKFGTASGLLHTRDFDGRALFDGNFVPVTALIRKRVFDAVGGFDWTWPAHEDHELWARMFVRGHRGVYVEEPLMRYRFHGQSRNTLTQRQRDDLQVRLVTLYPRYGWRWIARHPLLTARSVVRQRFLP
jgi:glycosyltransferase involved in cell wall biosynthesis